MGGWTTTYIEQTLQISIETAALVTAGFWLALTAGRMVSAAIGLRLSPERLLTASLAGASAGSLLMIAGQGNMLLTAAGVLLIGFCFGPIYPTMVAITTAAFPSGPGKAVSITAASGSLGGMAMPWMQGVLLTRVGPTFSAIFTLAGSLAMLLLAGGILLRKKAERRKTTLTTSN
jgi:fucose permease